MSGTNTPGQSTHGQAGPAINGDGSHPSAKGKQAESEIAFRFTFSHV